MCVKNGVGNFHGSVTQSSIVTAMCLFGPFWKILFIPIDNSSDYFLISVVQWNINNLSLTLTALQNHKSKGAHCEII